MAPNYNRAFDDKYEIIRQIKQGGFGIVYYGVDKKLNKPVAIKEIAPNLLDDPKYLDMFQEEALNIAKLSHNNIVHIYELKKTANGHLYIIMEYIDGIDLEKIIRVIKKSGRQLPQHLAVYIVAEICMALDYAHQRRDAFTNKPLNLVHQDISPSNIMISRFGGIKLIDFGIASVRRHHKEKKDTKLRGKIPYMAPEQLIMGNHPDHRSDLFSLGLVLFESITGDRLFNSQDEVLAAGKNPKWFRKALKGRKIPAALGKILLRALEIDLSKRYQTANHMYIDLLQYLISCNETGELMDDLALFLDDQFQQLKSPISTPNYYGTPSGTDTGISQQTPKSPYEFLHENSDPGTDAVSETTSLSSETPPASSHLTNSKWEFETPKTNEAPLASAFRPLLTQDLNQPAPQKQPLQSNFRTMEFEVEGEQDLKTVIDVVRISARNNKKRIFQVLFGLLISALVFGVFDTMNRWTQTGVWIYDFLFPPAIEITTVPANARISVDNQQLSGMTPLSIDKISPGVHKLELSLAGYKPIIKSLFVPREGAIKVQGGAEKNDNRTYLFRFNTEVTIDSSPQDADIYINGVRFNMQTPCTISWEAGAPFSLELRKSGFEPLIGYKLNTIEGYDEVEDRRFWDLTVYNDTYTHYGITGVFRKKVAIESVPSGVQIVDTKTDQVVGVTGRDKGVELPVGNHELEFRKDNFLAQKRKINIDEASTGQIRVVMSRKVKFAAVDELGANGRDLRATLISLKRNNRETLRTSRTTPVELALPAYAFTAVFSKPGYQRAEVPVRGDARSIRVEMERLKSNLEISVVDAVTEQPIPDAEILYNINNNSQISDTFLGRTNNTGGLFSQLVPGEYVIIVKKSGYNDLSRTITALVGDTISLLFKIYPTTN